MLQVLFSKCTTVLFCVNTNFLAATVCWNKMVGGGDLKVATVEVESVDNMATLPVGSRAHGGSDAIAEKNNVANKEMELKNVQPKPAKRCAPHFTFAHCSPPNNGTVYRIPYTLFITHKSMIFTDMHLITYNIYNIELKVLRCPRWISRYLLIYFTISWRQSYVHYINYIVRRFASVKMFM